jgi:hypothetical protein
VAAAEGAEVAIPLTIVASVEIAFFLEAMPWRILKRIIRRL